MFGPDLPKSLFYTAATEANRTQIRNVVILFVFIIEKLNHQGFYFNLAPK